MPTRFSAIVLTLLVAASACAQNWPGWRGPNHDGLSPEKGFRADWGSTAPPTLWKRDIGSAFSSFACVDSKVYTCGTQSDKQVVFCLHADTGDVLWQTPIEDKYVERQGGDGTRATPAVHGGKVYVQGALGRLVCLDADAGQVLWSHAFDTMPTWGYSASVLIEGDLAIATGNEALVALDKDSGTIRWNCPGGLVGYATPYPITVGGKHCVVGFMGKEALIADVESGRKVWKMPWETSWNINAATPIFHDDHLFLSSGYKHGATLLKLRRVDENVESQPVWESDSIRAKFQSPVLYEGHLYTSDEVGLKCVEWKTGTEKWLRRGLTFGTVVIADGQLIVLAEDGRLLIGRASPKAFEPVTDVKLMDGRHWTVPVLYRGRLYVRNLDRAACYNLMEH